jgi:hypothetical protein
LFRLREREALGLLPAPLPFFDIISALTVSHMLTFLVSDPRAYTEITSGTGASRPKNSVAQGAQMPWLILGVPIRKTSLHQEQTIVGSKSRSL